jgi:isopentenyl diphosphate isomerase/L-lactate dehydrogenase-like FMN-dependent dehydrogenase
MDLARAASADDLARLAKRRLPGFAWDFLEGGAGAEAGLRRNRRRLGDILLKPRFATGQAPDATARLFDRIYPLPLGIAPVGMGGLVWPKSDLGLARLAAAKDIPFTLGSAGSCTIEEVAQAAPGSVWFQLYALKDGAINADLMDRAWKAGIKVLAVTLDMPAPGKRDRDIRNRFVLPFRPSLGQALGLLACPAWTRALLRAGRPSFAVMAPYAPQARTVDELGLFVRDQIDPDLTWEKVRALRAQWPGTFLVKGLLAPEDGAEALKIGADGVWVSNHGGRQLESAPAAIDALQAMRAALGENAVLVMDGGVRSGEDLAKAVASGADFVFTARAFYYGLAAGGMAGVERAFALLAEDYRRTLKQIGCPATAALDRRWLWD